MSVGLSSFTTVSFEEVLEEREMGCLELALREVEGAFKCPEIDEDEAHGEEQEHGGKRRKTMQKKTQHSVAWKRKMGRSGGIYPEIVGGTFVTGSRRIVG